MATEPTIAIKKADGTTVRVPLSEFKKMHAAPAAETKVPESKPVEVVNKVSTQLPPPVKLNPNNEIVAARETSLLEENFVPAEVRSTEIMKTPPTITDETVRQIVRDSQLVVANDLWGRAQSLIASWLKGVRDNDQFTHYATAPSAKGGLGLGAEVAAGLLLVMGKYRKTEGKIPSASEPVILPKPRPPARPALEVPLSMPASQAFTDSLATATPKPMVPNLPVTPVVPVPPVPEPVAPVATAPIAPPPQPLPPVSPRVVQDIRVGAPPLTGPAEEMQSFTMTDWRRLGAQTPAAQTAFLAKFSGWRSESFLLYMDAVAAWQQSPVVRQYLDIMVRAVNEHRSIADVATETNAMTQAEWLAINAVNREVML